MNTGIYLVCTVCLLGAPRTARPESEKAGSIDLAMAARYFTEFDSLCMQEAAALWGVSLCGPILFVDPGTRMAAANRADAQGILRRRGGVFTGPLPADLTIANTAIEWQGMRWTMIMWWSMGGGRSSRLSLMAHESFHRLQPQLQLEAPGELNDHLDTAHGRFWLQMEWEALLKALGSQGESRQAAIADALVFRAARREPFPQAAAREVALEIHEGVAEYTGMRAAHYSDADVVKAVTVKRAGETGFVRSFAYVSGPLYGFLLDGASLDWRKKLTPRTDLGELLATSMRVPAMPAVDAMRRAETYGGSALRTAEDEREKKRQAQHAEWRQSLVEGPVLIVDLSKVTSGSFDPGKVFPMAEKQIVYTRRELNAEWGILTIDAGAILEDGNTHKGHVSLAGAAPDFLKGQGWRLDLADGWRVAPAARPGDFEVEKK